MRWRVACLCLLCFCVISCSSKPDDEAIASDIQYKLSADAVTQDSQVAVEVHEGQVTLRGKAKSLQARERLQMIARTSPGVTALNDLTSVETPKVAEKSEQTPPPAPTTAIIPAGTLLTIRTNQALGSRTSRTGRTFTGSLITPISLEGKMVIPAGSEVTGTVVQAKKAGRFKGGAALALIVHGITVRGHTYNIEAELFEQQSKGKGKRTTGMVGGGTGVGAVIGGIAGGGKGAAIGAVTGAAAGTIGALTSNRDIKLPAESAINFRLVQPLTLQTDVVPKS